MYGEYGLKEGCVTPDGKKIGGGYFLKMEAENYFDTVLSNTDFISEPRALDGTDIVETAFGDGLGGLNAKKAPKPDDICITLECTLEELYCGAMKQVNY